MSGKRAPDFANLDALDRYWRRSSFHDEVVVEVRALNKRVVIRLTDLSLVITNATSLQRCELPAVWLSELVVRTGHQFRLEIETESGPLAVTGDDVRLIRHADLAVLIPPVDG